MRQRLAIVGLISVLALGVHEAWGQCPSFSVTSCASPGTMRVCHRDGPLTAEVACTNVNVVAPATMFMFETSGTGTFIMASCSGPALNVAGNCTFQNCGICGSFVVDMTTGLPVELMEFSIEDGAASTVEEDSGKSGATGDETRQ